MHNFLYIHFLLRHRVFGEFLAVTGGIYGEFKQNKQQKCISVAQKVKMNKYSQKRG